MRVLYHHRTRAEDAQGIHINALCRAFEQLGHNVNVVALLAKENGQTSVDETDARKQGNSIMNFEIPHWLYECFALGYNIPAFITLTHTVLKSRPDLIYERYSIFTISGLLVSKLVFQTNRLAHGFASNIVYPFEHRVFDGIRSPDSTDFARAPADTDLNLNR